MPSSVVRLVTLDHRRLERLLERVVAPGPSRERWQRELLQLLAAHQAAEEGELYASLAADWGEQSVADVRAEADRLAAAADRLGALDLRPDGEPSGLGAGVGDLKQALAEHAHVTEDVLLPLVGERLERKRLRELGGRYEERREQELVDNGGHRDVPRRLDYSRAELYELARKAGIEGRSAMTREQLIDALIDLTPPAASAPQQGSLGG